LIDLQAQPFKGTQWVQDIRKRRDQGFDTVWRNRGGEGRKKGGGEGGGEKKGGIEGEGGREGGVDRGKEGEGGGEGGREGRKEEGE